MLGMPSPFRHGHLLPSPRRRFRRRGGRRRGRRGKAATPDRRAEAPVVLEHDKKASELLEAAGNVVESLAGGDPP